MIILDDTRIMLLQELTTNLKDIHEDMALCSTLKLEFTDIFLLRDPLAVLRGGHRSPTAMIRALGKLCKSN